MTKTINKVIDGSTEKTKRKFDNRIQNIKFKKITIRVNIFLNFMVTLTH